MSQYIRARADGVEVIETVVDDPKTGEKLLTSFLDSKESRIRGNAAKALYKFNKEKAMIILDEMVRSRDMWMRLSGAWALGEVGSATAVELLIMLLEDSEKFVKQRTMKSLEKIIHTKADTLPEVLIGRIGEAMENIRKKGEI